MSTRRLEHALVGADGVVLAEVCDDQVHTNLLHGPAVVQDWREWEVELVRGDRALLDVVEQRLLAAVPPPQRWRRSWSAASATRPLSPAARPHRAVAVTQATVPGSTPLVARAHLAEQVIELQTRDTRLRADQPGSVHKLRIAARRLRSALKTYRPLFAPGAADAVGDELRWLGQALAGARDAQVLRERLDSWCASRRPNWSSDR